LYTRLWLIAREGFSPEATRCWRDLEAYGSSYQQLELLTSRLSRPQVLGLDTKYANEFEIAVPMGGDNELIVARAVEQVARRLNFRPEAISQIKHAVVSLHQCFRTQPQSDQKLYQRMRVEEDKLVITISSRGIVPLVVDRQSGRKTPAGAGRTMRLVSAAGDSALSRL
jgi:hypothetical protein